MGPPPMIGSASIALPKVSQEPDWTTVPMPLLDATTGLTDIIVTLTYCVDQPLAMDRLADAFFTVVDAWPILSARVREDATSPSGLSYDIPSASMRQRLEIAGTPRMRQFFTLDESHRRLVDYWSPAGGLRSEASLGSHGRIRTFHSPRATEETRYTSFNAPKSFDEVLRDRFAVYTGQATKFQDGTMISITMLHTLGDGFCVSAMFRAWVQALSGIAPSPLQDIGLDLFADYAPGGSRASTFAAGKAEPPAPKGWHVLGMRDKAKLVYNVLQDVHRRFPESEQEQRYVCIPHQMAAQLQQAAQTDLAALAQRTSSQPKTVGKSDVVYAWLLKHAYLAVDRERPAHPLTILNLRRRRPEGLDHWLGHEFLNAALPVPLADLTAGRILDLPLGELALMIRQGVEQGSDPSYTSHLLTFSLHHSLWKNRKTNKLALFCPADSYWTALTDWRALKFPSIDWSAARTDELSSGPKPNVIAMHTHMETPMSKRQRWALIGDLPSGIWVAGTMTRSQWKAAFPDFALPEPSRL
ncbi:unnamed protein product [Parajaminaea phylloscopi]